MSCVLKRLPSIAPVCRLWNPCHNDRCWTGRAAAKLRAAALREGGMRALRVALLACNCPSLGDVKMEKYISECNKKWTNSATDLT